jgi:hypothetical protein
MKKISFHSFTTFDLPQDDYCDLYLGPYPFSQTLLITTISGMAISMSSGELPVLDAMDSGNLFCPPIEDRSFDRTQQISFS